MKERKTMPGNHLDYKSAGVDYDKIDPLKIAAQKAAQATAVNLQPHGFKEIASSRGESAYVVDMGDFYLASITECLGTKVLIADAVRKSTGKTHYDALAQDTLAMAINDIITVGATPLSVHAYWAAGSSEWFNDEARSQDIVNGWKKACDTCGVSWGGGETPALNGVVGESTIDLAASCVGIIRPRERLTLGDRLEPGNAIVFLAASGIHANGISLARKLSDTLKLGYDTKIGNGRSFGEALLDPTPLYSPVTEALFAEGIIPRYSANITGHGWRKIMRHPADLTYRITSVPEVPPVLSFIQETAGLSDDGAYGTFNMGAGFALFVDANEAEKTVKVAEQCDVRAMIAGKVESGSKRVVIEPLGIEFGGAELKLRT